MTDISTPPAQPARSMMSMQEELVGNLASLREQIFRFSEAFSVVQNDLEEMKSTLSRLDHQMQEEVTLRQASESTLEEVSRACGENKTLALVLRESTEDRLRSLTQGLQRLESEIPQLLEGHAERLKRLEDLGRQPSRSLSAIHGHDSFPNDAVGKGTKESAVRASRESPGESKRVSRDRVAAFEEHLEGLQKHLLNALDSEYQERNLAVKNLSMKMDLHEHALIQTAQRLENRLSSLSPSPFPDAEHFHLRSASAGAKTGERLDGGCSAKSTQVLPTGETLPWRYSRSSTPVCRESGGVEGRSRSGSIGPARSGSIGPARSGTTLPRTTSPSNALCWPGGQTGDTPPSMAQVVFRASVRATSEDKKDVCQISSRPVDVLSGSILSGGSLNVQTRPSCAPVSPLRGGLRAVTPLACRPGQRLG